MHINFNKNAISIQKIWILIGALLVILSLIYVPWHLSYDHMNHYYVIHHKGLLSPILYDWFWRKNEGLMLLKIDTSHSDYIDYIMMFRNVILSVCISIVGYIITSFIFECRQKK